MIILNSGLQQSKKDALLTHHHSLGHACQATLMTLSARRFLDLDAALAIPDQNVETAVGLMTVEH